MTTPYVVVFHDMYNCYFRCYAYATFKEPDIRKAVTLCGGKARVTSAYTSQTSSVQIVILGGTSRDVNRHFVLKYNGE